MQAYAPYRRWVCGLYRDGGSSSRPEKATYISDISKGSNKELIISKVIYVDKLDKTKDVRVYTIFEGYPSLYFYLWSTPQHQRLFHEVFPNNRKQKPRFDIDVSLKAYSEFAHLGMSFEDVGEYVKDMVIRSCAMVMQSLGTSLNIARDVCIFTSHGSAKRSYHIILSRRYHYGREQAKEFFKLCSHVHVGDIDKALFKRFVDSHVYASNASLRLAWCIKDATAVEPRVKQYCSTFKYEGKEYEHILYPTGLDEPPTADISNLYILAHSLVTFCEGIEPMPVLSVKIEHRLNTVRDMSKDTYEECVAIINKWNTEGIYVIDGESNGKIQLLRLKPNMCDMCNKPDPHEKMNGFCQIIDGALYYHCGIFKGRGKMLAPLLTVRSEAQKRVDEYVQMRCKLRSDELQVEVRSTRLAVRHNEDEVCNVARMSFDCEEGSSVGMLLEVEEIIRVRENNTHVDNGCIPADADTSATVSEPTLAPTNVPASIPANTSAFVPVIQQIHITPTVVAKEEIPVVSVVRTRHVKHVQTVVANTTASNNSTVAVPRVLSFAERIRLGNVSNNKEHSSPQPVSETSLPKRPRQIVFSM